MVVCVLLDLPHACNFVVAGSPPSLDTGKRSPTDSWIRGLVERCAVNIRIYSTGYLLDKKGENGKSLTPPSTTCLDYFERVSLRKDCSAFCSRTQSFQVHLNRFLLGEMAGAKLKYIPTSNLKFAAGTKYWYQTENRNEFRTPHTHRGSHLALAAAICVCPSECEGVDGRDNQMWDDAAAIGGCATTP